MAINTTEIEQAPVFPGQFEIAGTQTGALGWTGSDPEMEQQQTPPESQDGEEDVDDVEDEEEEHVVTAMVRGKECRIEYDKYSFTTPKMLRRLKVLQGMGAATQEAAGLEGTVELADALVYLIARSTVQWNVTDKAGQPVPTTDEAIEENLDVLSLINIVTAIQQQVFPGEATGSASPTA